MFQRGRKPARPSAGLSRLALIPFHFVNAASSEPYFFASQSPNIFSKMRDSASGMLSVLKVQKKNESSFCISRLAKAGSSTSVLPVVGLGVVSSALHHLR